jgi:predicted  nucleic acid-binding Zn-ribbon protein
VIGTEVNADLKALIDLQKADNRIAEIEGEKDKLPQAIEALRLEVVSSLAQHQELTGEIEPLKRRQVDIRNAIEEEKIRLAHTQERLPNITTQKAYYALLKEVETAEKAIESFELEIERLTEEIAALEAELANIETGMRSEEAEFEEKKASMEAEFSHLDEELRTIAKERETARAAASASALSRYKRIAVKRSPLVVVPARDGRCSGCNIKLPPQIYADVKRNDRINLCSHCHRILYFDDEA